MKTETLAEIEDFLSGEERFLVVSHFSPDGDAIGSLIAMGEILKQRNCDHVLAVEDAVPQKYSFMRGVDGILNLKERGLSEKFSRAIILDAGAVTRIGRAVDAIEEDARVLNIDHHFTGKRFGRINIVDVNASATAELIYGLCCDLSVEFTPELCEALYIGILTDTGRFRFPNTGPKAFAICSEMVERGVDACHVAENIYFNVPLEVVQALNHCISNMEIHCDGKVSIIWLDNEHYLSETEGFVEYASSIDGVEISGLLCEAEPGMFKVSLRSRCKTDVSKIALQFGGGGHRKAAGFRFDGDLRTLIDRLVEKIKPAL